MSGQTELQTSWEETDAEIERRRKQAQLEETGWVGTVVGLALAALALVALIILK